MFPCWEKVGPTPTFRILWDMYQLFMTQFGSQVVVGPIILMILWFSRVPIQSFVAVPLLRKSGTHTDFLDTLGHVPTGYETICVPSRCGSHYFDDSLIFEGTDSKLSSGFPVEKKWDPPPLFGHFGTCTNWLWDNLCPKLLRVPSYWWFLDIWACRVEAL